MKLSGILIASVTAQQPRQRENKEDAGFGGDDYSFGGADDAFASLYDSFGGDDAFGGFDMSAFNDYGFGSTAAPTVAVATDAPDYGFDLGDAFGDAGSDSDAAADYQNTVAADYDGADDLGSIRPSEDDEVKSNFVVDTGAAVAEENLFAGENGLGAATNEVQNLATIDIQINGGADAQRCFVGSAGNSNVRGTEPLRTSGVVADWFTNGVWDICEGENDTCEIKVVRRNEVIQQIHSKCANRHSCVDNMRQNFNPEGGRVTPQGNGFIFSTWLQQACRPRWSTLYGADKWNARQMSRDSVCFFCVEPCRTKAVWDGTTQTANAMRQAECVGRSAVNVWNAAPIPDSSMKIFDDCSDENDGTQGTADASFSGCARTIASDFGQTVWDSNAPKQNSDMSGPDMKKLNFYSVLDDIMLYNTEANTNHQMSLMQDVSQIQYAQILARDTLDFMTDAVDPNNAAVFEICDTNYCYSDDEKVGASNAERANLGNLFSGIYSRTATPGVNDFIIDIDFVSAKTFESLQFNKVLGANGGTDFADLYKNICLVLTKDDGSTTTPLCTDQAYGFTADDDALAPVLFDPVDVANVVKAQLIFDTSATGSDTAGVNNADYLALSNTVQIDTLAVTYT